MYPPHAGRLCFGADYNPEQWSPDVWREDVSLMRTAGVTMVTVGVFSWSWLEPAPGEYEFGWLDQVLGLLADGGIAVDLATATASPPPWFSHAYPESLPVDRDGRRLSYGSRQAYCPSSADYQGAALALVGQLADRYADHPALAMWHVNNEYGCHNLRCYCDTSAAAFRAWLSHRYEGDLAALNDAWGTSFWSQRYTDWVQVLPPRATPTFGNPGQELDFRRFCSAAVRRLYTLERDLLHERTPGIPVTTNFMAGLTDALDYWAWAPELDVVSTDHYLSAAVADNYLDLAYAADLTRGLARGEWLLMEQSTSAVNWQPRNAAKRPGEMIRNSLSHVARGSQGAMYFQWRASRAGAEKWHSAMVPHAGTDSQVWRDVVTLAGYLTRLAPVLGTPVRADVAILHDYPSIWAMEHAAQPSDDMVGEAERKRWHATLLRLGLTADLVQPSGELDGYRGRVPAEPLHGQPEESVELSTGAVGRVWSERGRATTATVLAAYASGPVAGCPAITRNGRAWYAGTRLAEADLAALLADVCRSAGVVAPVPDPPPGLEVVVRTHHDGGRILFLLNHSTVDALIGLSGVDLLTGRRQESARIPAGGVVVLHEAV